MTKHERKQRELDIVKTLRDKMAIEICRNTLGTTTMDRRFIFRFYTATTCGLPLWAFYQHVERAFEHEAPTPATIRAIIQRNAEGNLELRQSYKGAPWVAYWLSEDAQRINDLAVKWWADQGFGEKAHTVWDPVRNCHPRNLEELEMGYKA